MYPTFDFLFESGPVSNEYIRLWRSTLILAFVSCYLMWGMFLLSLSFSIPFMLGLGIRGVWAEGNENQCADL